MVTKCLNLETNCLINYLNDLSDQFKSIHIMNVMRQTEGLVVNPITVNNGLFSCTPASRAQMVSAYKLSMRLVGV